MHPAYILIAVVAIPLAVLFVGTEGKRVAESVKSVLRRAHELTVATLKRSRKLLNSAAKRVEESTQ